MASEDSKELEDEVAESLDARVFNPPSEPEESAPASVPEPPVVSQTPSSLHLPLFFNKLKDFATKTISHTSQPKTSVVPHLPSKYASTYELERFNENRMIIFNHDEFLKATPRPGTLKDEECLRETLEKFRFTIDPTHSNLEKKMLIHTVKKFALKTNFSRYGCICVVIMTHGYTRRPGYLLAYDKPYNEHEIFEHFDASKNPSLAGKPIIFIIQACRGAEPSPKVEAGRCRSSPTPQLDDDEERKFYHLPMDADRVVFHSSYVGRASVRHPQRGSWFIQTLCKKIHKFALTHNLETIFRMVRSEVALDCVSTQDWKQMPVVSSTTIRKIHFAPNISLPKNSEDMVALPAQLSNLNLSKMPEEPMVEHMGEPMGEPMGELMGEPMGEPMGELMGEPMGEPMDLRVPDRTPDAAISIKPLYMPCTCFLEYFEYLKNCLRSFVKHNAEDGVAVTLLKLVERAGDGAEYNFHKFSLIQFVWEHFEANLHKFPNDGSGFVYRQFY